MNERRIVEEEARKTSESLGHGPIDRGRGRFGAELRRAILRLAELQVLGSHSGGSILQTVGGACSPGT